MAEFVLSAFADEIDPNFDIQLSSLQKLGIGLLELRGVDGKSFTQLSDTEVKSVKSKLKAASVGLSALGSPIGKIAVDGDFDSHKKLLSRIMDIGEELCVNRIRCFSFYSAEGITRTEFENRAYEMMGELLNMADNRGFVLCHENEKDICGCTPTEEKALLEHFGGRLKAVLDQGNFAFCLLDASPAYGLMKDYIDYFHIKDADENGVIVPPGKGVAGIKELLTAINNDRSGKVILTMEPHLMMFTGLSSLSKLDDIKHKYVFDSPFEAFKTATESVRDMVASFE